MINKIILLEALKHYSKYSKNTKWILKILIELSVENSTIITVAELYILTGISKKGIYDILKRLDRDDYIKSNASLNIHNKNRNIYGFIINFSNMKGIIEHYSKLLLQPNFNKNITLPSK